MVRSRKSSRQQQQVMEQFPFSGEEQPSTVLQLATLPPHVYPCRLQPTHPNLQDFTLQYPKGLRCTFNFYIIHTRFSGNANSLCDPISKSSQG
ncbi:hypothetical protein PVL29_000142 [Vitis rotundifolia]|uniref:Uncharacterized protein n=1 Tax=Vitis rotundifolia TaxID=103349 RepID=A0AA39AHV9_VITRO|nr:hypothetical protein PVL29_000142 [Vitis rotundifolia]